MIRHCVRMAVTAGAVLGLLSSASCDAQTVTPRSVAASARADQGWGQPIEFGGQQAGALMADVSCPAAG